MKILKSFLILLLLVGIHGCADEEAEETNQAELILKHMAGKRQAVLDRAEAKRLARIRAAAKAREIPKPTYYYCLNPVVWNPITRRPLSYGRKSCYRSSDSCEAIAKERRAEIARKLPKWHSEISCWRYNGMVCYTYNPEDDWEQEYCWLYAADCQIQNGRIPNPVDPRNYSYCYQVGYR